MEAASHLIQTGVWASVWPRTFSVLFDKSGCNGFWIIVWTNFWYNFFRRRIIHPHLLQTPSSLLSAMTWKILRESGINPDWSIREHQPMCLHIMHGLSKIMQDPDQALFPSLIDGVGTGFQHDIPLSNCFPLNVQDDVDEPPLSAHLTNWQSAEEDLMLTRQLVQQENRQRMGISF